MNGIFNDTICAPATGLGGAIAVIRVSGGRSFEIADSIFNPAGSGAPGLSSSEGYTIRYGTICDGGAALDDVLVSVFRAPHSYTGEDSVEISCHASPFIVRRTLELLVAGGCRMAEPGEFTRRAFVAGKMDLSQAEAVADVIAAQTAAAHRIAINQLKGSFSDELSVMRAQLLEIVSLMELELDFSEEDVEFADRSELKALLDKVIAHIGKLTDSFGLGNAIKNGVPVAIVGAVNAGKSTLLNAIVGENRAIVSDIAGTTRDTIEEPFNIGGILFRFVDTAGLRQSDDLVERIGIERSYGALSRAAEVLCVIDLTAPLEEISSIASDIREKVAEGQNIIFVLNKADLTTPDRIAQVRGLLGEGAVSYPASARTREGLGELLSCLSDKYRSLEASSETTLVSNARHKAALDAALDALQRTRSGLEQSIPTDLVSQDIREALHHLASIVGEISTDEILGDIFGRFCIGK